MPIRRATHSSDNISRGYSIGAATKNQSLVRITSTGTGIPLFRHGNTKSSESLRADAKGSPSVQPAIPATRSGGLVGRLTLTTSRVALIFLHSHRLERWRNPDVTTH